PSLAQWDRSAWTIPAGGLGMILPDGRRTTADVHALFLGNGYLYVGGAFLHVSQADGTALRASGVAAYDPDSIDRSNVRRQPHCSYPMFAEATFVWRTAIASSSPLSTSSIQMCTGTMTGSIRFPSASVQASKRTCFAIQQRPKWGVPRFMERSTSMSRSG